MRQGEEKKRGKPDGGVGVAEGLLRGLGAGVANGLEDAGVLGEGVVVALEGVGVGEEIVVAGEKRIVLGKEIVVAGFEVVGVLGEGVVVVAGAGEAGGGGGMGGKFAEEAEEERFGVECEGFGGADAGEFAGLVDAEKDAPGAGVAWEAAADVVVDFGGEGGEFAESKIVGGR